MEFKITLDDTGLSGSATGPAADPLAPGSPPGPQSGPEGILSSSLVTLAQEQIQQIQQLSQAVSGEFDRLKDFLGDQGERRGRGDTATARDGGSRIGWDDEEERQLRDERLARLRSLATSEGGLASGARVQLEMDEEATRWRRALYETERKAAQDGFESARRAADQEKDLRDRKLELLQEQVRGLESQADNFRGKRESDWDRAIAGILDPARAPAGTFVPPTAPFASGQGGGFAPGGSMAPLVGGSPWPGVPQGQGPNQGGGGGLTAAATGALAGGSVSPVGIEIEAVKEAARETAAKFDAFREGLELVGRELRALASNDHVRMFNAAVDGASDGLKKIPIAGEVFAAALQAAAAPVRLLTGVVEAFVGRGQQLAQFSQPLSIANAQADVRTLLADIREADTLGPALADLTDAQSRISDELREIMLPIKEVIVKVLASFLTEVADHLANLRAGFQFFAETILDYLQRLFQIAGDYVPKFRDVANGINEIRETIADARKRADAIGFDGVFESLMDADMGVPRAPGRPASPAGLNIPGFNGGF